MSTQISLKLSNKMLSTAKTYADSNGYDSIQDFIRELLRERLFEQGSENTGGIYTYLASQQSLSRNWQLKSENIAWKHLEKEM